MWDMYFLSILQIQNKTSSGNGQWRFSVRDNYIVQVTCRELGRGKRQGMRPRRIAISINLRKKWKWCSWQGKSTSHEKSGALIIDQIFYHHHIYLKKSSSFLVSYLFPSLAPTAVCMILLKLKAWSLELGWGKSRNNVDSCQANVGQSQCAPSISLFLCLSNLGDPMVQRE